MINIDDTTYSLSENNYIPEGTSKDKIVIGITNTLNMTHYKGWTKRFNGNYKNTAMFTVKLDGKIYQHFSPNYFSNYMGENNLTEKTITILLDLTFAPCLCSRSALTASRRIGRPLAGV